MVKPVKVSTSPVSQRGRSSLVSSKTRCGFLLLSIVFFFSLPLAWNASAAPPTPPATSMKITRSVEGGAADNVSGWPSISADGKSIVFSSKAGNLVAGDGNAASDVFLYNTATQKIALASLSSTGAQANAASYRPVISAGGRFIAFTSLSTNLDAGDTNGLPDVYLRDLNAGTTIRVSRPPDGSPANGWSDQASLSADGRFALFVSSATNLAPGASTSARQVYLYDNQSKQLTPISSNLGDAWLAAISADGRYSVFVAARGDTSNLFLYDRLTGSTNPLVLGIKSPQLAAAHQPAGDLSRWFQHRIPG